MKFVAQNSSDFIPASHEDPRCPGVLKRVIAVRDEFQRGHVQMLNWARLPKGAEFRRHYHEDMQEVFVLLQGNVRMDCAGEPITMQAGDTVIVDPGEPHQMLNIGENDAEYIVFGISSGQNGRTIVLPG